MRTQRINRTQFYYSLYMGETPATDQDGFYTGEMQVSYSAPKRYTKGNISPATGQSEIESFGNLQSYDKVIVTGDMCCPINENSILWVDEADVTKPHDYIVKKIAKSKNVISIAIAKVKVSENGN